MRSFTASLIFPPLKTYKRKKTPSVEGVFLLVKLFVIKLFGSVDGLAGEVESKLAVNRTVNA